MHFRVVRVPPLHHITLSLIAFLWQHDTEWFIPYKAAFLTVSTTFKTKELLHFLASLISALLDSSTLLLYTISLDALHFQSINPDVSTRHSDETAERCRIWRECWSVDASEKPLVRSELCLNALAQTLRKSKGTTAPEEECVLMVLGCLEGRMCRGQ